MASRSYVTWYGRSPPDKPCVDRHVLQADIVIAPAQSCFLDVHLGRGGNHCSEYRLHISYLISL